MRKLTAASAVAASQRAGDPVPLSASRWQTLVHPTQFGGRTTYSYDARRRIVADSAQISVNDSLTYDRRDKVILNTGGTRDTIAYDAFGHTTYADINTSNVDGQYDVDAMGNRSWSRDDRGHLNVTAIDYQYTPGTGRLSREADAMLSGSLGDTTWSSHDGIGNMFYSRREKQVGIDSTLRWTTYNDYDGFNRLTSHVMVYDSIPNPHEEEYRSSEYYRYDALGRRVWYHAVRDTSCSLISGNCVSHCEAYEPATDCISPITRVVWDGHQILYEMRADGGPFASSAMKENDNAGGSLFGRVGYTHGLAIDTPLGIIKGSDQVIPWTNWRGQIDKGTCPVQMCSVSQVKFPQRGVFGASGYVNQPPPNWYGSLIEGQRDGSGYIYQRNRYLDPSTGRFTQEDPIGLAGGLNLYGYAGGDPVNFSDPFGLCPPIDQCSAEQRLAILAGAGERLAPVQPLLEGAGMLAIAPLAGGMGLGGGISAEAMALGSTLQSGAGSAILTAGGVAQRVAAAVGGSVSQLAKSEGFKVTVQGGKNIVARIKSSGEMRVGIDRVGSLTRDGIVSSDRALTHLKNLSTQELIDLVNKAKQFIGARK